MALKSNCSKTHQKRWLFLLAIVFVALWVSLAVVHTTKHPSNSVLRGDSNNEASPPSPEQAGKLSFQPSPDGTGPSTFKILQIADLHLGESSAKDAKTLALMESMVAAEQPNLIVLSGDQITADNVDENATAYYQTVGERLSGHGIPWALVFGNHDDAPYEEKKKGSSSTAKTSREQLLAVDQKFPLSLTQSTPDLFGSSNYQLDIHYPSPGSAEDDVAVQAFFLDSGGGALKPRVGHRQVDWFQETHDPSLPGAVVFQHMPTQDFVYDHGRTCRGNLHDNGNDDVGFDPIPHDSGLVRTLQEAGNVRFLAVGHNHGNDYCCPSTDDSSGPHLCFGRRTGYGGYGDWNPGARVYELELLEGTGSASLDWKSWVRMGDETIVDPYEPNTSFS